MIGLVRKRLWDLRALCMKRHRVVFSSDRAGWVLDQVARELVAHLPTQCRPGVSRGPDMHFLRNGVVHFLGQFDVFGGITPGVHRSNRLVATWWHGDADSSEEALRHAFSRAVELSSGLDLVTVTCSRYELAWRAAGLSPHKLIRLPLGVDTKRFRPPDVESRMSARQRFGLPPGDFCIGSFQKDGEGWGEGLDPKRMKGPDVLLEMMEKIAGRRFVVLLAGPARGYVVGGLKKRRVQFVNAGFVPPREMPALYRAIDAYVIPSREEGGPAALLEAMSSGVPVVSTDVGMAADIIRDGTNGFVVPVADAQRLADSMNVLMDDAGLRKRLATEALTTVQSYDWRDVAQLHYETLYRPLMQD